MNFLKKITRIGSGLIVWEVALIGILAALLTAIEIYYSQRFGLLASPPQYDGIGYMLIAKSLFYRFGQGWFQSPSPLLDLLGSRFPLWTALMLAGFSLFGEGEWQCYIIRFFPTFLLLLLMLWIIRRRANRAIAWVAVLFTALLPLISVSLRATQYDFFAGQQNPSVYGDKLNWYLADLRPNLLFAVLLGWAIAIVIEEVYTLNRYKLLAAGGFGGLALLSKTAFLPIFLFTAGLTALVVFACNYKRLFSTFLTCLWALPPFILLMLPWTLTGGIGPTLGYIYEQAIFKKSIWSNPNATFVSEATYFWDLFSHHMGPEGWFFLSLGLISYGTAWVKLKQANPKTLAYLVLAIALYILISINPVKDLFTGQLYYLLLWLFAWTALAPVLLWIYTGRYRWGLLAGTGLYGVTTLTLSLYALSQFPREVKQADLQNHAIVQQIGSDMKQLLTSKDCFVPADITYWNTFEYYMVDGQGNRPKSVMWDSIRPVETIPPFIQKDVSECRAILVHKEDVAELADYLYIHPTTFPFFRAVKTWITQPNRPYKLFREYQLVGKSFRSGKQNLRELEMQLYLK